MTLPESYLLKFDEESLKLCDDRVNEVPSEDAILDIGLELKPAWPPLNKLQPTLNLFKLVGDTCLGQRNIWWLPNGFVM